MRQAKVEERTLSKGVKQLFKTSSRPHKYKDDIPYLPCRGDVSEIRRKAKMINPYWLP